ncbi:GNAT family N-acetyltransferase [Sinorhizobium fredii]|uniref:GNAT family N-acetyltransferase n=1 Tax=Rhizobium fredii TaxID=380 RepID=UPI003510EB8C
MTIKTPKKGNRRHGENRWAENEVPAMTDPMTALDSFQRELPRGSLQLQRCETDKDLFVHVDQPTGTPRFTYVRLDGKTVTALAIFALVEPIERTQCFHLGYAVPERYRGQGKGKDIVAAAMKELANGFSRTPITTFYVEAVVGADNEASHKIATKLLSGMPTSIMDEVSGSPAFHYLRKVNTKAP